MKNKVKKTAVFTMDFEAFSDTGCISEGGFTVNDEMLDGFDEYMDLLEKYDIKATVFAVYNAAVILKDKIIARLNKGHRIALHGYDHTAPILMNTDDFVQKTKSAKNQLEELLNTEICGYRAPFFGIDNQRLKLLQSLGFKYDSSRMDFRKRVHSTDVDVSSFEKVASGIYRKDGFYEFSLPCYKGLVINYPISGGGYVRLGNWNFVKTLIQIYVRKNDYYVFYIHPFELSSKKAPIIKNLKRHDKFYLKYGFFNYKKKIEKIIKILKKSGYEFITFEDFINSQEI